MATQIKDGVNYPARKATEKEERSIQIILDIKDQIKTLYKELGEEMLKLERDVALVCDVEDGEKGKISKTFILGTPTGHFVTYKELDLVMNKETTKKLLKEIEGN